MTEVYGTCNKMIMRGGKENGNRQVENGHRHIFQKASVRNETRQWPVLSDTMMR